MTKLDFLKFYLKSWRDKFSKRISMFDIHLIAHEYNIGCSLAGYILHILSVIQFIINIIYFRFVCLHLYYHI